MSKKSEFSKKLCNISIIFFLISLLISVISAKAGIGDLIIPYLIPSSGAITAAAFGFYFNKAKAENLSKQRLRTVLIRLVLEGKLDEDAYTELIEELSSIDQTLENKLAEMHDNAINEETDVSLDI